MGGTIRYTFMKLHTQVQRLTRCCWHSWHKYVQYLYTDWYKAFFSLSLILIQKKNLPSMQCRCSPERVTPKILSLWSGFPPTTDCAGAVPVMDFSCKYKRARNILRAVLPKERTNEWMMFIEDEAAKATDWLTPACILRGQPHPASQQGKHVLDATRVVLVKASTTTIVVLCDVEAASAALCR